MDEILKGLQSKNLTKKGIFNFLADINLEELLGKSENPIKSIESAASIDSVTEVILEEYKCGGCSKTFATKSSLKRHLDRFQVCKDWMELPQKTDAFLSSGLHHIVDDLLEKSIGENDQIECKFCKTKFITKGNHHKHFNTAKVCNKLAFVEFKKLINNL